MFPAASYLPLHPFTRREIAGETNSHPFLTGFMTTGELPKSLPRFKPVSEREVYVGGMPSVCLGPAHDSGLWFKGFEQTYLERDIRGIEDPLSFRRLIRLAALRTGNLFSPSELARDAKLTSATAARYLGLMELSFVASRLPPFLKNRASRLIKSPKFYMSDSGVACHLAGVAGEGLLRSFPSFGALFETYAWNNLAAILSARQPEAGLSFWGVQGRHEVDFVIESGADCWAVEVKAAILAYSWSRRFVERRVRGSIGRSTWYNDLAEFFGSEKINVDRHPPYSCQRAARVRQDVLERLA